MDKEDTNQDEDFLVEKIVNKKFINGKPHYLIKWKGYPSSENTWEPYDNIDADDLIKKYEEKIAKKSALQESKIGESKIAGSKIGESKITDSKQDKKSKKEKKTSLANSTIKDEKNDTSLQEKKKSRKSSLKENENRK
ncbi:chromo domain-containing protein [Vairimorpha necatrix]|uniref:Chromo domain-containing protein n=1 Tax=Vairimorpha necatrix TaxID=6039 RepID=A0AAX4JFP9_9MICR